MMLLVLLLFLGLQRHVLSTDCDLSNQFSQKIESSDLIIVGRILNLANGDVIVSVIRILKGFDLINEVKKISHENDYHLILVRKIKYIINCQISIKSGEDFILYLKKTEKHNFFELNYAKEFGNGLFEKRISMFLNGGTSKLVQNDDPCSKLNCKFGAQCQKWPGNPPTAVCHCSNTQCPAEPKENSVCGSDGIFYDSHCLMKRQECFLQKSIQVSSNHICGELSKINNRKEEQQDGISKSNVQFCQHQSCPPYAICVTNPYPYCKCPNDKCDPSSPQICGTDEITYTNICEMKKVSCKANRFIEQQYVGRCDICKFVKCEFNGICEMMEDGLGTVCKCPNPDELCTKNIQVPVCGSDDVTYQSECHLKIESCKKKISLSVMYKGECQTKIQSDICAQIQCHYGAKCIKTSNTVAQCSCDYLECKKTWRDSVCGNDGIFYDNECLVMKTSCEKQKEIHVINSNFCDPCSLVNCSHNMCSLDANRKPKCDCPSTCKDDAKDLLCGSSGKTYDNSCLLNLDKCQTGQHIYIVNKGPCQFENNPCNGVKCPDPYQYCRIDNNGKSTCECPKEPCSKIVQPVCGNDKITYESICNLTRTACLTKKPLWIIYNGICNEEPRCKEQEKECPSYQICKSDLVQTKCECPTCPQSGLGESVCGTDGKTYKSECHMRMHACETNSTALKIANIGTCDKCKNKKCSFYSICQMNRFLEPQCICPTDCVYVRRPVCGSDDRTYENECFLKVKSCAENRLITAVSAGPCKRCPENCPLGKMCRNGRCVCTDKCSKVALRVCGTDGNYYENECELKRKACIDNKTIRVAPSVIGCISQNYIADEKNKRSCLCNSIGSMNHECDPTTMQCTCKTGVTGQYCDRCVDGYWNFTENGCTACSCNKFGSESIICNIETGKCNCKPLAMGKYCSVCPIGHSLSNHGCKENSIYENKLDAVELGFLKDSFAKSYWSGNAENYLSINISLVSYSSDGIIFYHSDTDRSSDYLTIVLKNRYIEYRVDLGSGAIFLKSRMQLTLGRSHSILVERLNRDSRLVIDGTDSQYGMNPPFLTNLDAGFMFTIGQASGSIINALSHTGGVTDGFVGCLSSLKITAGEETKIYLMNQQTSWIIESSNVKPNCPHMDIKYSVNVIEDPDKEEQLEKENLKIKDYCQTHKPCLNGGLCKTGSEEMYSCQCLPGYQGITCEDVVSDIWKFMENSFVVFPSESLQLRQRLKLEIKFLPISSNGLLSFISDGHDRNPAFISVTLNKNHLEVTCRTPIGVTKLISMESALIGKWNHVVILKAAKYIYLNLNHSPQPIKKRLIPKRFWNVDSLVSRKLTQFRIKNQPIFFGGVDSNIYNSFSNVVSLKPNFHGAIQKIVINDENIRFQNSDIILNNITQWQGSPCGPLQSPCSKTDPEKGFCVPEMNETICTCSPKHENLCIRNSMQHDNPTNTNFFRKYFGKSASKYPAVKQKRDKSSTKNNIRIKFKTGSNDGMLILLKKIYSIKKSFLVIAIRNGVIEVAINLGGKNGILRITGDKNISDNKWHTVQVIRNNRNVVLLIDDRMFRAQMLDNDNYNTLTTDGWMWLGGAKKPVEGFPWEYNTNFKGCISELYVDEISYNLVLDARKNIGPILRC